MPSPAGAALEQMAAFKQMSLEALDAACGGWAAVAQPGLADVSTGAKGRDTGTSSEAGGDRTSKQPPSRQAQLQELLQELADMSGGASGDGAGGSGSGGALMRAVQDGGSGGGNGHCRVLAVSSCIPAAQAWPPQTAPAHAALGLPSTTAQPQPAPATWAASTSSSDTSGATTSSSGTKSSSSGLRSLPFEQRAREVVSVMCPGVAAAASSLAAAAGEGGASARDAAFR